MSFDADRALGTMVGLVAGDNLGALVEFEHRDSIAETWPVGPDQLIDGGVWGIAAGQATDDGEMALALAWSMVETGTYDAERAAEAYADWLNSGPFDVGNTIWRALKAAANAEPGERAWAARIAANWDSEANGALMRAAPIGIVYAGDPDAAAAAAGVDAYLSHPAARCIEANRAFCAAISVGVAGGTAEHMLGAAKQATLGDDFWSDIESRGGLNPPQDFFEMMGWVDHAFRNAFSALIKGEEFQDAVVRTVRGGGDTDTNAAIVGALLGARDGIAAIPPQWRETVMACQPDQHAPTDQPRPQTYWPSRVAMWVDAIVEHHAARA